MTQEEYYSAIDDVIYLAACAVNEKTPDAVRTAGMNLSHVYLASENHLLAAAVGMALQAAGVRDEKFLQALSKAQRKNALMDTDKAALFARLEQMGIWYMPLKGAVLKDLYPQFGMRQMADTDILIDAGRTEDVRDVMESLGFTTEFFGTAHHDVYRKPPVSNFEIHTALFGPFHDEKLYRYYRDVETRLVNAEGTRYGRRFTPEDLYIYMTAHEYKHYTRSGTGLRSLLDVYVFLKKYGQALDYAYIEAETDQLGIGPFERRNRSLAMKLFTGEQVPPEVKDDMLEYIIRSGVYGTVAHRVENNVQKLGGGTKGKARYFFRRVFLPMSSIRVSYPTIYKYRIPVLPFFWAWRIGKGLLFRRAAIKQELKALFP